MALRRLSLWSTQVTKTFGLLMWETVKPVRFFACKSGTHRKSSHSNAALVTPDINGRWKVEKLTTCHNGDNDLEVERVLRSHPGEPECVIDRRVLGALAPFRCSFESHCNEKLVINLSFAGLGDVPFKQPPDFSRRILYNLFPGFHDTSAWEEFLIRNHTPPYISAQPEITHRRLDQFPHLSRRNVHPPRYLILSSDGFTDLCIGKGEQRVIMNWAENTAPRTPTDSDFTRKTNNMALRLLRHVLGGDDCLSISRVLTLDMDVAWIDDTAIIVQTL
jgi:pyruvate dehydrogenase phosphatase